MDTFQTADLRDRVLAAWAASPARFREDANAEEELALGAYRDRLVVELAQNAADAATRADVPGRLLLRLEGSTLIAANNGAALDMAGVEGLSTLRASPKRAEETVGRFGVGFAAVLAVTDEPTVVSRDGGVRWSRSAAIQLISAVPEIAPELQHRDRAVPILRLPFPAEKSGFRVPDGYDTAVILPLRDGAAAALAGELLDAIDDALPLVLPALREIVIEAGGRRRTITTTTPTEVDGHPGVAERRVGDRRWRLAQLGGVADIELLADRPVEERMRPQWSVTVAVPVDEHGAPASAVALPVVHAPTPTDDPTALPALVIAGFPLDSTRRRVAPGRFADFLAGQVGHAYARLVASFETASALTLVPGPLGAGELDASLHRSVHDALAATAFIPSALDGTRLRPGEVTFVEGLERAASPSALVAFVPGLPDSRWWNPDVLRRIGSRTVSLDDVVDDLGTLDITPTQWRDLYAALDGADLETLAAVPVPLTDGRLVRGPRSVLLPADIDPGILAPFRLRVAHPDAVHPLLGRLGAAEAGASSILRDPAVQAVVETADDDEADSVADAVLRLVATSGLTVDDEPWLGQLLLRDGNGDLASAHELMLPGSPMLAALDADPRGYAVADDLVGRHGEAILRAVGVREGFGIVQETDVALDDEFWHDLDGEDDWAGDTLAALPDDEVPPVIAHFVAVRDLDLLREDAWPRALAWLAADPATRAAVVDPAYAITADGTRVAVESYTAWWLRTRARIDGWALEELCTAEAQAPVRALLHPVSVGADRPDPGGDVTVLAVDDTFAAALGIARSLPDVPTAVLLDRLGDEAVRLPPAELMEIYAELAGRRRVPGIAADRLRVPDGAGGRVVDAADVVVCAGPHWLQLGLPAAIPGSPELAEMLGVDLAEDAYEARMGGHGEVVPVPDVVSAVVAGAPATYVENEDLSVAGRPVDWWMDGGVVHAATLDGLARGIAWAAGKWERRWLLAEALQDPGSLATLLAEDAFR